MADMARRALSSLGDNGDDDGEEVPSSEQFERTWPKYVNVYLVELSYGGPQEGGWWFDLGEPQESVMVRDAQDLARTRAAVEDKWAVNRRDEWDSSRKRGKSSAAGGYDIVVTVETHFAEHYPERRPRYE